MKEEVRTLVRTDVRKSIFMSRKSTEKNIRKITKVGKHSYAVILPIETVRKWGWQEKQKVVLEVDSKKKIIEIKDWKK